MVHTRGVRAEDHKAVDLTDSNSPASGCQPTLACGSDMMLENTIEIVPSTTNGVSGAACKQHAIDVVIGKRIKKRRLQLRLSQTALGAAVGVSFQQVQKYERGANRVSAATLYELAHVLDAPISFFFDGLAQRPQVQYDKLAEKALAREEFVATGEGQRLVDAFLMAPKKTRSKFIILLATFATDH